MQSAFVIISKFIASKKYLCKELFCNNFGRDGTRCVFAPFSVAFSWTSLEETVALFVYVLSQVLRANCAFLLCGHLHLRCLLREE